MKHNSSQVKIYCVCCSALITLISLEGPTFSAYVLQGEWVPQGRSWQIIAHGLSLPCYLFHKNLLAENGFYITACMFSHSVVSDSFETPCSPPGSAVHGNSQARILGWIAISFSKGFSRPRDWAHASCIGRQILYHWANRGSFNISKWSEKNQKKNDISWYVKIIQNSNFGVPIKFHGDIAMIIHSCVVAFVLKDRVK